MAGGPRIALERMSQQSDLLGAKDDWTGVTSSVARRRVQNRINQRASRQRKRLETGQGTASASRPKVKAIQRNSSVSSDKPSIITGKEAALIEKFPTALDLWKLFNCAIQGSQLDLQKLSQISNLCKLGPLQEQKLISEFQRWLEYCQRSGSPRIDQVLVFVKFNVLRAILSNGLSLGYAANKEDFRKGALSPFADHCRPKLDLRAVPAALQPTELQRSTPHHPWIDLLPSPEMRDNLLLAGDTYNVMELCADLVGFFSNDKGRTGMIVWGEPWSVAGWEVTESFVKHWGWTIQGCTSLLQSTNYWRQKRGEGLLQVRKLIAEGKSEGSKHRELPSTVATK